MKYSDEDVKSMKKLYIEGKSQEEICKILDIPHGSIWKFLKNIPPHKRKKLPINFRPKHNLFKSSKDMSKEKARIIGYLAADGYVNLQCKITKRPYFGSNKTKYRKCKRYTVFICFYNKEYDLIKRFMKDIYKVYGIKPKYKKKKFEVKISSIEAYKDLTRYCKFKSREWTIPKEILKYNHLKREWLRAFCDGEAHVDYKRKKIEICSVNKEGLSAIKEKILKRFNINSQLYGHYKPTNFRLCITRYENISKFNKEIGFNHPKKIKAIQKIL